MVNCNNIVQQQLPDDICCEIMSYLDTETVIINCLPVSKQWYREATSHLSLTLQFDSEEGWQRFVFHNTSTTNSTKCSYLRNVKRLLFPTCLVINEDLGIDLICSQMTELTELDISNNSVSPKGIESLAKQLKKLTKLNMMIGDVCHERIVSITSSMKQLTNLNLSFNYLKKRDLQAICESQMQQQLKKLDLSSGYNFRNEKGVELLLSMKQLQTLNLNCCMVGYEEIQSLVQLNQTSLKTLGLYSNCINLECLKIMAENMKQLTKLDLGRNDIDDKGAQYIGTSFTQLTNLNVQNNCISVEGMKSLCQLTKLRSLQISSNKIQDEGLDLIGQSLKELRYLGVEETGISNAGLSLSIPQLPNLTILRICKNPLITVEGVKPLEKLKRLEIDNNQMDLEYLRFVLPTSVEIVPVECSFIC